MKRCNAREEEFAANNPSTPERSASANRGEFKVTIIGGAGLAQRLATEVSFVIEQLQRSWPEFKRDPIGLIARGLVTVVERCQKFVRAPNVLAGAATAMLMVLTAVMSLLLFGWGAPRGGGDLAEIDQPVVQIVSLRLPDQSHPDGSGVGVRSNGRVGLASGKGEGSKPQPQQSRGGGGSGNRNPLPPQQGAVPQPSALSAPINPPLPNAALPVAGTDIDRVLWQSLPFSTYGDPRSKSTFASKGPGDGGAIGTGQGLGNGEGDGNGVGPGSDGNIGGGPKRPGGGGPAGADGGDPRDPNYIFPPKEVSQRAKVLSKPEPGYTEEARKLDITGTVVLRAIFSFSGEVTGIRAIKPLPGGLTERAIAAARQIRFVPAMRNGQPVSCYMQLEYNFNLY